MGYHELRSIVAAILWANWGAPPQMPVIMAKADEIIDAARAGLSETVS